MPKLTLNLYVWHFRKLALGSSVVSLVLTRRACRSVFPQAKPDAIQNDATDAAIKTLLGLDEGLKFFHSLR